MNAERAPRVVVLAGVNGAGKSTAAREVLLSLNIPTFVNAVCTHGGEGHPRGMGDAKRNLCYVRAG